MIRAALVVAVLLLVGCQGDAVYTQADIDERDDRIAELEDQLSSARSRAEELESRLQDLQSASENLQANVDRLDFENWRDVVPDIESASAEVWSAEQDAADASEDLGGALAE